MSTITWERRPVITGPVASYFSTHTPSGHKWEIFPEIDRAWSLCFEYEGAWSCEGFYDTVAQAKAEAERDEAKTLARLPA